jgi:hypothetical protein
VVKVLDTYKYLGVDAVDNVLDWTKYFNRAIAKATRVSEDFEWACRRGQYWSMRLKYGPETSLPPTVARAEAVQTNFA